MRQPPVPSGVDEAPTYVETRSNPPDRGIPFDLTPPPAPVGHAQTHAPTIEVHAQTHAPTIEVHAQTHAPTLEVHAQTHAPTLEVHAQMHAATIETPSVAAPPSNTLAAPPPQTTVAPENMPSPEPAPVSPVVSRLPRAAVDSPGTARKVEPRPNRDELLGRLRTRASELEKARIDEILASRR